MTPEQKIAEILKRLKKEYPEPRTALRFSTPFELLVATILSAQTTDVHVNKVTPGLFAKYRSVREYADAVIEALQKEMSSINFYRTKAKNIQAAAKVVQEKFGGEVPRNMEDLVSLPGVARKTANVLLNGAFGINEGIAVDTHVKRLADRLGLTEQGDPAKIERDLMAITPQREWGNLSHLLIFHGRRICTAKKPLHDRCVLSDICPSGNI
ncbi:MAG: endonuclease III [Nitrospirales bacterium]|nr:endonuclease III [Nitrospirales bacterium]